MLMFVLKKCVVIRTFQWKRGIINVLFLNKLFRTILIVTISGFSSDTLKGKVVGIKKQTHVKNKVVIYCMISNNLIKISCCNQLFWYATDTLSNESDIVSEQLIWIKIKIKTRNKFQQYLKFYRYNVWKYKRVAAGINIVFKFSVSMR